MAFTRTYMQHWLKTLLSVSKQTGTTSIGYAEYKVQPPYLAEYDADPFYGWIEIDHFIYDEVNTYFEVRDIYGTGLTKDLRSWTRDEFRIMKIVFDGGESENP